MFGVMIKKIFVLLLVAGLFLFGENSLGAMSSTNYYIYADAISVGGILSTGGEYSLQDTIGESIIGTSTGSSYEIKGGYQFMERDSEISLSISSASLSLGTLVSSTAFSSASTTVSVDAFSTGFVLSVSDVSGNILTPVTDGQVDGVLGIDNDVEEYGLAVAGIEANFLGDQSVTTSLVLASSSLPVSSNTILTFKAIRNASTTPGSYTQNITLTASANF